MVEEWARTLARARAKARTLARTKARAEQDHNQADGISEDACTYQNGISDKTHNTVTIRGPYDIGTLWRLRHEMIQARSYKDITNAVLKPQRIAVHANDKLPNNRNNIASVAALIGRTTCQGAL